MTTRKLVLPLVVDEKMELINAASENCGVEIEMAARKSPRRFLGALLGRVVGGRAPNALLVRYLNSPRCMLHAMSWWAITIATLLVARMAGIKLLWLLHNVDRETIQPYGVLTQSLRRLLGSLSSVILVTDPLLVDTARKHLPGSVHSKIDYITYGQRRASLDRLLYDVQDDETDLLTELIARIRQQEPHALIGFCPTSAGEKFTHLTHSATLARVGDTIGVKIHIIVVGPIDQYLRMNRALALELSSCANIHLISRRLNYDPSRVGPCLDFYWRSLSDQSVSYTLYEAASVRVPVLTMDCGFMATAVPFYRLGACLQLDFSNASQALTEIRYWDPCGADEFLRTHSWSIAASKLAESV